jgi:uncharacterized protein (TIGR02145 family)
MKKIVSLHLLAFIFLTACAGSKGSSNAYVECDDYDPETHFCDTRDGKTYKYVKIGEQVWMAENLKYYKRFPEAGTCPYSKLVTFTAEDGRSYKGEAICDEYGYGRLYTKNAANNSCPEGWRLPTFGEWKILIDFVGGEKIAGKHLKAKSGWANDGNGLDTYGFEAMPVPCKISNLAGSYQFPNSLTSDNCGRLTHSGSWLSMENSKEANRDFSKIPNADRMAFIWSVYSRHEEAEANINDRNDEFSVRCIKD